MSSLVGKPRTIMPPDDDQKLIADGTTLTATTNGTALDLGAIFGKYTNPQVQLKISAIKSSVGTESYDFKLQQADDSGFTTNVEDLGNKTFASAVANDLDGVINLDNTLQTNSITRRYVRIVSTLSTSDSPSITLAAYLSAYS